MSDAETLSVELWYPRFRSQGKPRFVVIDLVDTRAAEPIRVSYDFSRDGWTVERRQGDQWKEAAFVQESKRPKDEETEAHGD